jgi:hypothetical protein
MAFVIGGALVVLAGATEILHRVPRALPYLEKLRLLQLEIPILLAGLSCLLVGMVILYFTVGLDDYQEDEWPIAGSTPDDTAVTSLQPEPLPLRSRQPQFDRPAAAFVLEGYASAGPRKRIEEFREDGSEVHELCEDAVGVISLPGDSQIFWLCDGTSSSAWLPPFEDTAGLGARMLARDLGEIYTDLQLRTETAQLGSSAIWPAVLEKLRQQWHERLDGYLTAIESTKHFPDFVRGLASDATGAHVIKWSSTFLGGRIEAGQGRLSLIQAGDAGAVLIDAAGKAGIIAPNPHRVLVRARITRDGLDVIVMAGQEGDVRPQLFDGVEGFIAMSDGISSGKLDDLLPRLGAAIEKSGIEDVRRRLLRRRDASQDDKSMVIGRRLAAR